MHAYTQTKYGKSFTCGTHVEWPHLPVQFTSGHSAILLPVEAVSEALHRPVFTSHCILAQPVSAARRDLSQLVHPPYVPVPPESLLMPVSSPEPPHGSLALMLSCSPSLKKYLSPYPSQSGSGPSSSGESKASCLQGTSILGFGFVYLTPD